MLHVVQNIFVRIEVTISLPKNTPYHADYKHVE